ncbi:MAG: Riboflavin biosynthesis protein RibBA [Anaerolineales bacterium]|nr:Riboflavin biosynthesis protein RibBA [Anaerolineales bacterium]WKZ47164.1 MAG: GTP cyclohydrolase II [Anaerolineales bacterium]
MITDLHEKFDVLLQNEGEHECEGIGKDKVCVRVVALAELPTRFGEFHIIAFENNRDGKEHVAIVKGDVIGASDVPVRLHSECLTGDALGSLRCDCRDQLEASLKMIGGMECGMVLYLRQEGRGIGLINKIRAYSLQDQGLDTVEANHALGFRDDERDYAVAAHMLMSLKLQSVQLITNNPKKIQQLIDYGIQVSDRIPHIMEPNEYNRFYLETKAAKSGHLIDFHGKEHLPEQSDRPFIKGMSELEIGV